LVLKELYVRLYSGRFARNDLNLNYFKLIAFRLHQQVEVSKRQASLNGAEPSKFPPELIRKYQLLSEQHEQQLRLESEKESHEETVEQNPTQIET
jgi:hypothetical protein